MGVNIYKGMGVGRGYLGKTKIKKPQGQVKPYMYILGNINRLIHT